MLDKGRQACLKLYVSSVELVKHRRTQIVFQDIFWAMVTAL